MIESRNRPFRAVLSLWLALIALAVAPVGARAEESGEACGRSCGEAKRTCAASATEERRSCYTQCRAEGSADACREQCRAAFSEDKEQCKTDLRECREACMPSGGSSPCLDACKEQRRDCVQGEREVRGGRSCARGCVVQGREARAKCGGESQGNCQKQASDELSACLGSCADANHKDDSQCRASFRACVEQCEPPACGGVAGGACPTGLTCVDDASDDCDPAQGGADCPGHCVAGEG